MSFPLLDTTIRKTPLGPQRLNGLRAAYADVGNMMRREHIAGTGEHNAWEIPRVARRIAYSAGYTISPSSSDITAVASSAAGTVTLTLAANRFTTDMRVQLNASAESGKPVIMRAEIVSATSLKIYIDRLSSALGAGNTWARTDLSFDVAIYSEPLSPGYWGYTPLGNGRRGRVDRGETLEADDFWNNLVMGEAEYYAGLTAEHTSAGVHNTRQVPKKYGRVKYKGGTTVSLSEDPGGVTLARTSAGIYTLTWSSALTTPTHTFCGTDYSAEGGGTATDVYLVNAVETSSTVTTIYLFLWDAVNKWWTAADGDFWFTTHGG